MTLIKLIECQMIKCEQKKKKLYIVAVAVRLIDCIQFLFAVSLLGGKSCQSNCLLSVFVEH